MHANRMKRKLLAGEPAFGVSVMFPAPQLVEMLGALGFDWVLLDCEHGALGPDSLELMAMAAAAARLTAVSPEVLDSILPAPSDPGAPDDLPLGEPLSGRESEILALLADGAGNKEIASRLHISEHTVKFHVSSILAKLGAATRTEAVGRGYREGLIVL